MTQALHQPAAEGPGRGAAGRPLRILHVRTVRGTGGGPDKTVLKSCQYLAARGQAADAFYIFDAREARSNLLETAQRLSVRLVAAYESTPVSPGTLWKLHRILRQGRYDIVHTHEYKSNALAVLLQAEHAVQVVATAHGYNQTTWREGAYYAMEQAIFRHLRAVVTPTRDLADFLHRRGVPRRLLHVIPNAIEVPPGHARREKGTFCFSPVCPAGPAKERKSRMSPFPAVRLLYLGRLSLEKDPLNLLQAAAILRRRGLAFELTLAGDGPERAHIEHAAAELGIASSVRLAGYVGDVIGLLTNADILVSPSRTECMPNAVLEAMLAGVPVVATAVGGLGEMIRDGEHGLLCPPRNPPALAAAIERLVREAALPPRLADNAYRRVTTEYAFDTRMERILRLYRRVMETQCES